MVYAYAAEAGAAAAEAGADAAAKSVSAALVEPGLVSETVYATFIFEMMP
jgi:hypothetical protein